MRVLSLLLSLAVTFNVVSAQTTFCKTYTAALNNGTVNATNQYALLNAVVTRTILGCNSVNASLSASNSTCGSTGNTIVVGLLDLESNNRGFFDGTGTFTAPGSVSQQRNNADGILPGTGGSTKFVNFTAGNQVDKLNPAATFLIAHLIQWFGRDLGCDVDATGTGPTVGISTYDGVANMTDLHKNMIINKQVWTGFGNALVGALTSFGVPLTGPSSIESDILPYASSFLRAPTGVKVICNQPDCDCAIGYTATGTTCTAIPSSSSSTGTSSTGTGSSSAATGSSSSSSAIIPSSTAPAKNGTASAIMASPVIILGAVAAAMLL